MWWYIWDDEIKYNSALVIKFLYFIFELVNKLLKLLTLLLQVPPIRNHRSFHPLQQLAAPSASLPIKQLSLYFQLHLFYLLEPAWKKGLLFVHHVLYEVEGSVFAGWLVFDAAWTLVQSFFLH